MRTTLTTTRRRRRGAGFTSGHRSSDGLWAGQRRVDLQPSPTVSAGDDSRERRRELAATACDRGNLVEAEAQCRRLLAQDPEDAAALYLLGVVLHRGRRDAEALACLRQAARSEPDSPQILAAMASVHAAAHELAAAQRCYEAAIARAPDQADLYYGLGNACHRAGALERAVECFRQATALNPNDHESWHNLGKSLRDLTRVEEAIMAYERALNLVPSFAPAVYGRALALLTVGRWREGFAGYETRPSRGSPASAHLPRWQGEPIPGKVLLCQDEQGFGDAIQAVRFLALARERAGRIVLECRPELRRLFHESRCADEVVACGQPLPRCDVRTWLLSLPACLGTTLETVPHRVPYLRAGSPAPPLPGSPGRPTVGLAWAGNPAHDEDASRSLTWEQLAPVLAVPGIAFYSLQTHDSAGERPELPEHRQLADLGALCQDFRDTAGYVQQLDLVIAVDTAVAHLAGALGRPVWTLLAHRPDWRWLLHRADTVWYPTMRLFRQPARGQWAPVLARVAVELARWTALGVPTPV